MANTYELHAAAELMDNPELMEGCIAYFQSHDTPVQWMPVIELMGATYALPQPILEAGGPQEITVLRLNPNSALFPDPEGWTPTGRRVLVLCDGTVVGPLVMEEDGRLNTARRTTIRAFVANGGPVPVIEGGC